MNAQKLVDTHGAALVGREVVTQPYGHWPGGLAVVTEVAPDPNAPEIVFTVKTIDPMFLAWVKIGRLDSEEIGVFDHEEIELRPIKHGGIDGKTNHKG